MKKLNYFIVIIILSLFINCKKGNTDIVENNTDTIDNNTTSYPTEGLIANWTFDNDSNDDVIDNSGYEINGKSYSVKYEDGVIGKSLLFDGETSKIIIPDANSLPPESIANLEKGTISGWFKFTNKEGQVLPILYFGKATSTDPPYGLILEIGHNRGDINNRRLYFTIIHSQSGNQCFDSGENLLENTWYHFAIIVSESGNTGYLNGIEITNRRYNLGSDENYTVFFNNVPNKEMLSIGYGRYSQEEPFYSFNGNIDNIMIYNRALTKEEVVELYNMRNL